MLRILFAACALVLLLAPDTASAWGFQGHRVVGSIAEELLLNTNAAAKIREILNEGNQDGKLTMRLVGPWADCVRSVKRNADGTFDYKVDPNHLEYEVPCTPFDNKAERARLLDYAARNWSNCSTPPRDGCHTNYHFEDVAIQRDGACQGAAGRHNRADILRPRHQGT